MAQHSSWGVGSVSGGGRPVPRGRPGQQGGRSPAYLGAGVHEHEVLAVQPQEAGAGQGRIAHSQHHVNRVPEEGQLAHGLCRRKAGLVEKLLSSSTLGPPSWVPPSPSLAIPLPQTH